MKVIIIGGATAGMTTASKLKRNLKDKVEIVAYQNLSYPSLGRCGIPYYIGKNFDEANIMIARTVEKFTEEGITVHTNYEITNVDFPNKTVKGINLITKEPIEDHYDKLVIAVGGSLDKLNLPGNDAHNIYAPATLEAAVKIREELTDKIKTVVVVGGGPIGLEFCENFARNDKRVILIEEQDQVLKDLVDPEIAEAVQMELERKSVELKLNTKVKKLHVKNKMINQIELATGEMLDVDLVICALGFTPNTQFLADSEISMNPQGSIVVNDRLETNILDVYAVGDCVLAKNIIDGSLMQIPSSTISIKQGKVLANVLAGKDDYFQGAMGTMILQIFDLEIARTGFTEEYAKKWVICMTQLQLAQKIIQLMLKEQNQLLLK
ncbi:FAD-dependent oxidoreductase [Spiroplasma eriocheiris]|uniref:Nitrite reductase n=1 Tax=Spiroplasma eriocheiris TaxID=315358 RepID=A0A0H3XLJ4_9MOLU|nr:FAD-dependent oxidoreductase [Spiroplasma eriocheiris]AHF57182.1 NADH oxidase [Spiroplasma eriocheiris CCTCC M 207170]AKM53652.1 nitrite reductase [Spiroplasma eriocheiris]